MHFEWRFVREEWKRFVALLHCFLWGIHEECK
jgi:hypothetical protein